jgi:hypothetical protein
MCRFFKRLLSRPEPGEGEKMDVIIGLPRWDDPATYYSQANNAVESMLKKMQTKTWLATCGPTAAVMLADAAGHDVRIQTSAGWDPQPEDLLALYFNDPRNYQRLRDSRPTLDPAEYMGNEVAQYYPVAMRDVFGIKAIFTWGVSRVSILTALRRGAGVMLCLEDPGHYIAVVAYNTVTHEVIYNDPWPGNYWPAGLRGQPGWTRVVKFDVMATNLKPYRIEIG